VTSSGRGTILFVEQYYYPDGWGGAQLPRDITIALARADFDVAVLCGSDPYAEVVGDPGLDPTVEGVKIRRVPRLLRGPIHQRKLLRQLWFYLNCLPGLFVRRPPGLYVVQTNPPLALVLVALAARAWRKPLLIIAMDIYPDVIWAHGALSPKSLFGRILRQLFDWSYRSAARVVSLGPTMTDRLKAKGVDENRIVEISNWATGDIDVVRGDANSLRREWGLEGRFVVLYSGNLGIGHEFETLLRGFAGALSHDPDIRLIFIGRGKRLQSVKDRVTELGIQDAVLFKDFVSAETLPQSMGLADVAVVTLRDGFEGLIVPSKLLGFMARGIPVLYVGPKSDIEHYVLGSGCGMALRTGDESSLRAAIARFRSEPDLPRRLGEAGKNAYDRELAREHGVKKYVRLASSLLSASAAPSMTEL
jgi:colanic acid biosynthesis glycosyl transferase WcaI